MTARQTDIVRFALTFLQANMDSDVEEMLTEAVSQPSTGTLEEEIEGLVETLRYFAPAPE